MVVNLPFWKPPPFLFHGTIHSLILVISALYFRTCFVSISESLEGSLSAAEMLFCLCRQWDICSVTDGWRVAAGPCIADLTNAVQTRPGILYAVCVSVTDSLHVTVWPLSSDPRSRHVTIHLPLWHEWLSSTTDPSSSPQGAPGLSVWTGTSGLSGTEEIHTRSHFTDLSHVTAVTGSSFFCLQFSNLHEFLDISVTLWAEGNISEASGGSKEDVIAELLRRRSLFIIENIKYTAVWHAAFSFFNTKPTTS